jgi:DNA polymerase-3 subunit alpha
MNNMVHLHVHSDFSPQDGASSVDRIAEKAARLSMSSVALTDHGRAGGLLQFKKACEKHGVKPIYGVELYIAPRSRFIKEKIDGFNTSYHLTVLAKNEQGLRNIFKLTSIGWLDGYYYKPRVDMEILQELSEGLVVLSGCASGFASRMIVEGRLEEAEGFARQCQNIWKDDFYIEIQNHGMDWQEPLLDSLLEISSTTNIPIVGTQDSHFIEHDEAELHSKICKITAGDLEFGTTEMYFKSYEEMAIRFSYCKEALDITNEIADKCNCNWNFGKTIWPIYRLPENKTPYQQLEENAWNGFRKLFGDGTEEYRERLEYELGVINRMDFPTYFLVVADFIQWARDNGIPVGPGRGSGAGSLVLYCIGITQVDPIKYGLYFERFLNPARVSLPDIDVDFCPRGRKDVMQYVANKYGVDKTAQIGTYAVFKPRGSLRDFARVCGYDISVGSALANLVPPDVAGRSATFDEVIEAEPKILKTNQPEVVDLARRAEGLRTKAGVHAAGVIISDRPIMELCPLFIGKGGEITTQFDMHDIEELGLVKYDFLGLINLTIIDDTVKMIKDINGIEIDIDRIDTEDQDVFENIFHTGDLDGIFQFETSSGFRELCMQVKPTSIEDLSSITALFRPGPLLTGLTKQYIGGRRGEEVRYLLDQLKPILEKTYGVITYQEQIMEICTDIAKYTLSEADNMRKIIGKKLPEKMRLEKEKFVSGAVDNGIPRDSAEELFGNIEGFVKYSFNKAHSVAYSIISYKTAWLKHYWPVEFYCSILNSTINEQNQLVKYIHSCKDKGIPIEPPDINRSYTKFTPDRGTIIFGLAGIKGIGEKACDQVLKERPEMGFEDLNDLLKRNLNSGTISALAKCGALASISPYPRAALLEHLQEISKHYKKLKKWEERRDGYQNRESERLEAIEAGKKPPRKLPKLPPAPELDLELVLMDKNTSSQTQNVSILEKLQMEKDSIGYYLTGHPLDQYPYLTRVARIEISDLEELDGGETVSLPVVISTLVRRRTSKGMDMATMTVEDKRGRIECIIFPGTWKKIKDTIEENQVAIITCKVEKDTSFDDDSSITKLILLKYKLVENQEEFGHIEVSNIEIKLRDGSVVTFIVPSDVNIDQWQKAMAIATNLEKIG